MLENLLNLELIKTTGGKDRSLMKIGFLKETPNAPTQLGNIAAVKPYPLQLFSLFGYLFAYFEYVGDDFDADMAKMASDPKTQEWWDIMMPMQEPLETRADGEWWANMEEVFHTD